MDLRQNVTLASLGVLLLWWVLRGVVTALGYAIAVASKQWLLFPVIAIAGNIGVRVLIKRLDQAQLEKRAARDLVKALEKA